MSRFWNRNWLPSRKSSGARVLFSLFCWQLFFFMHFLLLAIILPVLPSIDGFWRSLWYRPHFLIQIDILPNISRRHAITDRNTGNGWFKNGFQNNYRNISRLNFFDKGLLFTRKLLNQEFLLIKLKSSLRKYCGHRHGISVSQMTTDISHLSWALRVPLVAQELPTLPEHLCSPPVFSWVYVTWSLGLCVCL